MGHITINGPSAGRHSLVNGRDLHRNYPAEKRFRERLAQSDRVIAKCVSSDKLTGEGVLVMTASPCFETHLSVDKPGYEIRDPYNTSGQRNLPKIRMNMMKNSG